jgi:hypothetical protein
MNNATLAMFLVGAFITGVGIAGLYLVLRRPTLNLKVIRKVETMDVTHIVPLIILFEHSAPGSDKSRLYLARLADLIGKNPEDAVARLDAISVFRRKKLWGGMLKKVL